MLYLLKSFRGIDLESMSIGQQDALLVFRTLCKVGFLSILYIIVGLLFLPYDFLNMLLYVDGDEGR